MTSCFFRSVLRQGATIGQSFAMAAALLLAGAATAQDTEDSLAGIPELPRLQFEFTTGAWFARPGGSVELGSDESNRIEIEQQLGMDSLESTPIFEFAIRRDSAVQLLVNFVDFDSDASSTFQGATSQYGSLTLLAGDAVRSRLELLSAGAEFAFDLTRTSPASSQGTRRPN